MKANKKTVKKLTTFQIQRIWSLSKKGLSQRKIAEKVGCGRGGVFYHLHKI